MEKPPEIDEAALMRKLAKEYGLVKKTMLYYLIGGALAVFGVTLVGSFAIARKTAASFAEQQSVQAGLSQIQTDAQQSEDLIHEIEQFHDEAKQLAESDRLGFIEARLNVAAADRCMILASVYANAESTRMLAADWVEGRVLTESASSRPISRTEAGKFIVNRQTNVIRNSKEIMEGMGRSSMLYMEPSLFSPLQEYVSGNCPTIDFPDMTLSEYVQEFQENLESSSEVAP